MNRNTNKPATRCWHHRLVSDLKCIGLALLILGTIAGLFAFDYRVWRLQHPDAPTWTYFLRSDR